MKRLLKTKTIQVTLVLSFILHVFLIGYFNSIFVKLPVEKKLKKQSVAYIALGKKARSIIPVGNPDIQKYDELAETQDSGNRDIVERNMIPEKTILKKSISGGMIKEIQPIHLDKKEKVFFPETMMPKINEEQTDALTEKDVLPEEIKETSIIENNDTKEDLPEKPENESTGQFPREHPENIEEDGKTMILEDEREANEEILDFTGNSYSDNVIPPELLEFQPPIYPKNLRERDIEGKVMLKVFIDTEGKVGEIHIFKSSGYEMFDQIAIKAVRQWRFKPAKKENRERESRVLIPINFQIK